MQINVDHTLRNEKRKRMANSSLRVNLIGAPSAFTSLPNITLTTDPAKAVRRPVARRSQLTAYEPKNNAEAAVKEQTLVITEMADWRSSGV